MFEQGIKQVGLKYGPQNKFAVRIPPTVGKGAVSVACVHLSVCPSVTYIAKAMPKFGRKIPQLRCDSHTSYKQTVKGQGWRRSGAYRVGRTRRPHCLS